MNYSKYWKILEELPSGGQGKVYRVSKLSDEQTNQSSFIKAIRDISSPSYYNSENIKNEAYETLRKSIIELLKIENPNNQGALKVLHNPKDARDANLAEERIKREIKAMSEIRHPNLLKILEYDSDFKWYVSEYHHRGTLANNNNLFVGMELKSLKAFRFLVEGVAKLHEKGIVHRDIKPQNVFVSSDDKLVLGDFGLVYFSDNQHTRISSTFENVGSRNWMPAWAMGMKIENLQPNFDVFSLGKLIWFMISGKPFLRLWYFKEDEFNLEKILPESQSTFFVNELLSKCIVEKPGDRNLSIKMRQ